MQCFQGAFDHGSGTGVGFETTPAATATLPRLRHLDLHVPQLGAVTVLTLHHPVIQHDAAANAGAQREEDHAAYALAGPHPELPLGCGVGIVLKGSWHAERVVYMLPYRHV